MNRGPEDQRISVALLKFCSVKISMSGYLLHDICQCIVTMLQQISWRLMHWITETCICVRFIGDLMFDTKGTHIYVKEEEEDIYLYYSCPSMNYIFHETALENPMHCIIRDIHILPFVYWCLWMIILNKNYITHDYLYSFFLYFFKVFWRHILVTLIKLCTNQSEKFM